MKNHKPSPDPIRLPYFDWDKAKYFYYVAKFLSLSEAARFLNTSQPALSKKISTLEYHLRCKLFTRNARGLELTRKGQELFVIIEQSFLSLKGFAYSAAVSAGKGKKRHIRIATSPVVAAYVLHKHLMTYHQQHPCLIFEIISNDHFINPVIYDIDLALYPLGESSSTISVQQTYLFQLKKKLYASPKYLETYGEPQKLEDLKHHYLLSLSELENPYTNDVDWLLKLGLPEGASHEAAYISNSFECYVKACQAGLGIIGACENYDIIQESGLKNILPFVETEEVKYHLFFPDYLGKDEQMSHLRDYLSQAFA